MEVLYPRCAGLDVHQASVVACVRIANARASHEVRTFETTTKGLLALADRLEPFREALKLLLTIPGISQTAANVIASEMGLDMTRFASAECLISWAGLCPRSEESAGKRRSTRIRKGAPGLKATLIQAAWAAVRTKNSYLRPMFHRLKTRRGAMKAIVAVAAAILRSAYYMLTRNMPYQDLGPSYYEKKTRTRTANRLLKRLKDLGIEVLQTRITEPLAHPVSL